MANGLGYALDGVRRVAGEELQPKSPHGPGAGSGNTLVRNNANRDEQWNGHHVVVQHHVHGTQVEVVDDFLYVHVVG